MMNVQNNRIQTNGTPIITWTDNPNPNISYKVYFRHYDHNTLTWRNLTQIGYYCPGVQYHLASGIYIARFTAGENMLTTKMILSK
jgi:hypothetical protein